MKDCLSKWRCLLLMFVTITPGLVHAAYFRGEIEVIVSDYINAKKAQTAYHLNVNGLRYRLKPSPIIEKENLLSGDYISIEGTMYKSTNGEEMIDVIAMHKQQTITSFIETKQRKALVLLLDFKDKKATDTTTEAMLADDMYTDKNSVRNIYLKSSFKQVDFIPDANGDGQPDIYVVKLNSVVGDTCKVGDWAREAKAAAKQLGIDTTLYQHFVFILPRTVGCSFAGRANIGCGKQCHTWMRLHYNLIYAHELGHNLGLRHAATDSKNEGSVTCEYCDGSTFMSNSGYYPLNAPQRKQLNWFAPYPNLHKTLTKSTKVTIATLDNHPETIKRGVQLLELSSDNVTVPYFLSYRVGDDVFGMAQKFNHRVTIHRFPGPGRRTLLISRLAKDDVFVSAYDGIYVSATNTKDKFASVTVKIKNRCHFEDHPCKMSAGERIDNLNGKVNNLRLFVPENTKSLVVYASASGATARTSLFVKRGAVPTKKNNDCRSRKKKQLAALRDTKSSSGALVCKTCFVDAA